jgi:hypothetical protein
MSFAKEMDDFIKGWKAGDDMAESASRTRLNKAKAKIAEGPNDADLGGIPDPGRGGGDVPQVASPSGGGTKSSYVPAQGRAEKWRQGISNIESGGPDGNYRAVGPKTDKGDHAYGRYQVMGANIPTWTKQILGKAMTPGDFLADDRAQDKVFDTMFGDYVKQYGERGAASMWFTGKPTEPPTTDVNGKLTGKTYADKFVGFLGGEAQGPNKPADSTPATSSATPAAPAADTAADDTDTDPEQAPNTGGDDGSSPEADSAAADDSGIEVAQVAVPEIGLPQVTTDFSNPLQFQIDQEREQQLRGGGASPGNPNDQSQPTAYAAKGGKLPAPKSKTFQAHRPEEANYMPPPVRGGKLRGALPEPGEQDIAPAAASPTASATTTTSSVTPPTSSWLDQETMSKMDPKLLKVAQRAYNDNPNLFALNPLTKTLRTPQEQQDMVNKGWSKTMHSKHLEGKAIDLVPINPKTNQPDPTYRQGYGAVHDAMQKAAKDEGVTDLQWGGNWKSFPDLPHYQVSLMEQQQQGQPTAFAAAGGVLPEPTQHFADGGPLNPSGTPDKYNAARAYTQPIAQSKAPQMEARRITLQPTGGGSGGADDWRSWETSGSPSQLAFRAKPAVAAPAAAAPQQSTYAQQVLDWQKKAYPMGMAGGVNLGSIRAAGNMPQPGAGASAQDQLFAQQASNMFRTDLGNWQRASWAANPVGSREQGGMVYHGFAEGGAIPEPGQNFARGGATDPNRARAQAQGDVYRASRDDEYWRARQPTVGKSGRREESGIRYTSVAGDRGPQDTRALPPTRPGVKPGDKKGGDKKGGDKKTESKPTKPDLVKAAGTPTAPYELRRAAGTPFPPEPSTFPARPEVHSDNTYPTKPQQGPPAPRGTVGATGIPVSPAPTGPDTGRGPTPNIDLSRFAPELHAPSGATRTYDGSQRVPQVVMPSGPAVYTPNYDDQTTAGGSMDPGNTGVPTGPSPAPPVAPQRGAWVGGRWVPFDPTDTTPPPAGAWVNGQWVPIDTAATPGRGFARGGAVPEEDDGDVMAASPRAESANYTTSAPGSAPAPAPAPAAAPVARPAPVPAPAPAAAPDEEDRPKADVQPTPKLLQHVGDAVKGGADFLLNVFGLHGKGDGAIPGPDAGAQAQQGVKRFASNEGAATPDEIQAVDDKIDPNRELSEGDRQMTRLAKTTQWYLQRGEKKKAEAVAASLMQYGAQRFGRLGQIAQAGYQKYLQTHDPADLEKTTGYLSKAYEMIPDGSKTNITVNPETHMLQSTRTNADGEEETYDISPDELPNLIQKTVDQSSYWNQIFQLGDPQGQKQKALDRRAAQKDQAALSKEERVAQRQQDEWDRRHGVVRQEKTADAEAAAAESDRKKARDEAALMKRWKIQHPGTDFGPVREPFAAADAARRALDAGVVKYGSDDDNDLYINTPEGKAQQDNYDQLASRLYDTLPMSPKDRMAWMKANGFPEEGWNYVEAPAAAPAAPGGDAAAPAATTSTPAAPAAGSTPPVAGAVLKKDRDTGRPRWAVKQNGQWMWVD